MSALLVLQLFVIHSVLTQNGKAFLVPSSEYHPIFYLWNLLNTGLANSLDTNLLVLGYLKILHLLYRNVIYMQ